MNCWKEFYGAFLPRLYDFIAASCCYDLVMFLVISFAFSHASAFHLTVIDTSSFSIAGYENEDWFIPFPVLSEEQKTSPLSPEQVEATLAYFGEYSSLNTFYLQYH